MLHTSYLKTAANVWGSGKNLLIRTTGRFYTPETIGKRLTTSAVALMKGNLGAEFSIIDPFCGDGRLLVWTLEEMNRIGFRGSVRVVGWDLDEDAVRNARENLASLGATLNFKTETQIRKKDSFAGPVEAKYDIVITNPPWDVLKPDRREMDVLTTQQRIEYVDKLKHQSLSLRDRFPYAKAAVRFSTWSQNLARVGLELSLRLTKRCGVCGIVLPATLLADQASSTIRNWIFANYAVEQINFYSAERRLFATVDQPVVAVVIGAEPPKSSQIKLWEIKEGGKASKSSLNRSELASMGNRVPLALGAIGLRLQCKLASLGTFNALEEKYIWAGRELDETDSDSYLSEHGEFRFVKGRMVGRFEMIETPSRFISSRGPAIPQSSNLWRLAWRDVSRPSQRRRMQATLLPPTLVTGNSLNIAYMRDGNLERLKWLLGIMNSLVFEFQIRAASATSHVSLSTARVVKVPPLDSSAFKQIARLTTNRLQGTVSAEVPLEIAVAKAYGLSKGDFEVIVSAFQRLDNQARAELLQEW